MYKGSMNLNLELVEERMEDCGLLKRSYILTLRVPFDCKYLNSRKICLRNTHTYGDLEDHLSIDSWLSQLQLQCAVPILHQRSGLSWTFSLSVMFALNKQESQSALDGR